jgi:Flp pilus assembly protein TadB
MARLTVAAAIALGGGLVLMSMEFRWGRRLPLVDRLAPYVGGRPAAGSAERRGPSIVALALPLAHAVEAAVDRTSGAREELGLRLARTGSPLDPVGFRLRQLAWGGTGLVAGLVVVIATRPSWGAAVIVVAAASGVGLLAPEQRLRSASERARRAIEQELPLVIEQMATMLDAGLSVHGALQRLADRGRGRCSRGFADVCVRLRHGVPDHLALRDWAATTGVVGAARFASLLALVTPELGRLLEAEARVLRQDAHRRLVERIERRSQQVWIPVTVATLVPGVLFLAVPFIEAMRLFSAA